MLETYGVAPWFGLFKWTKDQQLQHQDEKGKVTTETFHSETPSWISVERIGHSVTEDDCLFWRPYKGTGKYVDPTGGSQWSVAYWCAAMHRPYDKKTDRCK